MQRRDRGVLQSLQPALTQKVKTSRVLVVGAGGIGCELLKNLVCCGFGSGWKPAQTTTDPQQTQSQQNTQLGDKNAEIVVVDLDTIDLSNLNRQFLFRKQHIKKPKAFVAKETASRFNPHVTIDAHHASIFDSQYDVDFFEGFDLVFNALDNLPARRHVNRMCLAANVPLIESGTTGFNGQVQAIQKGITECYDCNVKPVQKSFPICTIRSTPSQPIHCIVWAKSYLLPELFGTSEDEFTEVAITDTDNAEEVAKLKEEAQALKRIRDLMGQDTFAKAVFNKVFFDDIERLRSMSEMWKSRKAPESLRFERVCIDRNPESAGVGIAQNDQHVWSLLDNLKVFCYSVEQLSKRVQAGETVIEFDKDDKDTLDFVASSANLRSHVFGIPLNSEWEIKQMAGNIIPAIATSNALTASLCVLQAFKILRHKNQIAHANSSGLLGGSKMVFLQSKDTARMINSQSLLPPREDCAVCSPVYAKLYVKTSSKPLLQNLVDLLKKQVQYDDFSVEFDGKIIYDPDLEDNLGKSFQELGIEGNGFITIQDDAEPPKVDLVISIKVKELTGENDIILSPNTLALPLKPTKGVEIETPKPEISLATRPGSAGKRKRDAEDLLGGANKKVKQDGVIDDEDDGLILVE
jgi:ubiquitin-like 1-activating enzyme E1 B